MRKIKKGAASIVIVILALVIVGVGAYFLGTKKNQEVPQVMEHSLIRVSSPTPQDLISSPLVVTGEARGYWFFEASFPIEVLDGEGGRIGISFAEAEGEWMTENFVPFRGIVEFETPSSSLGTLVFHKDNPSGLGEHDDSFSIPVRFRE